MTIPWERNVLLLSPTRWSGEIREDHMKIKYLVAAAVALSAFAANAAIAQQRVKVPITNKEWEQPFPDSRSWGTSIMSGLMISAAI
jgi:hypothetical protein